MWCWPGWGGYGQGGIFLLTVVALGGAGWLRFRSLRRTEPPVRAKGSCPACGSPVEPAYFRCPECGKSLKTNCPYCSRVVEMLWSFCPYCSRELTAPTATNPQPSEGETT